MRGLDVRESQGVDGGEPYLPAPVDYQHEL